MRPSPMRWLCLFAAIGFISVRPQSFAAVIDVSPLPSLFKTGAPKNLVEGGVAFDIDKRAVILLKLPHVAKLDFSYKAEGYFRLYYATAVEGNFRLSNEFLMSRPLLKNKGRLKLDLRHTLNWSADSFPLLIVEGTGRFSISNLKAFTVSNPGAYRKEKNRAFFWRPEVVRETTINFLTPVYWDFENKMHWPVVLGALFFLAALGIAVVRYFWGQKYDYLLRTVSILFILIYSVHFLIRFLPIVNFDPFISNNEKVKKNYSSPEFGQLAAAAREIIKPDDRVVFLGEEKDWFSPKALCFNIAPTKCVLYEQDSRQYASVRDVIKLEPSDVNIAVHYNSAHDLLPGFEKLYELNKNVFIAVRK